MAKPSAADMKAAPYWPNEAKGILRAELDRRGLTYARLTNLLNAAGIPETTRSLPNKISRGSFSFVFFLQVMRVLGVTNISLAPTQKMGSIPFSGQPALLADQEQAFDPELTPAGETAPKP